MTGGLRVLRQCGMRYGNDAGALQSLRFHTPGESIPCLISLKRHRVPTRVRALLDTLARVALCPLGLVFGPFHPHSQGRALVAPPRPLRARPLPWGWGHTFAHALIELQLALLLEGPLISARGTPFR